MTLDVHGFDGQAKSAEPAPPGPGAAPAAPVTTAPPQATPGASVQPDATPQTAPAAPAAPVTPIRMFGRDFASVEQAEAYSRHMVRSAEGRLRSEFDALKAAATPQPPEPAVQAAPTPEAGPQGAYDVETYKLVKERFGEDAAEDYRSKAISEHQEKVAKDLLDHRLAPFEERRAQENAEAASTKLFADAIAAKGRDGKPVIPELEIPGVREEIVKIWSGFPYEYAMTPKAIWDAAMIYRGAVGSFAPVLLPKVPEPSGQSVDASNATPPAFVPGQQHPSSIPRPSAVNPVTGERYSRQ